MITTAPDRPKESQNELAFYDAVSTNESAVEVPTRQATRSHQVGHRTDGSHGAPVRHGTAVTRETFTLLGTEEQFSHAGQSVADEPVQAYPFLSRFGR